MQRNRCDDSNPLHASDGNRIAYTIDDFTDPWRRADDAAAAARRDGIVEALVCRGAGAVPPLPRGAHGPARPRRIAGAAAGTAAVDGPAGAGRARTARPSRLRRRAHRRQLRRRLRGAEPGDGVARARAQPDAVRFHAGTEEQPGAHLAAARRDARGCATSSPPRSRIASRTATTAAHIEWFLDEAAKNDTAYIGRFVGLMTTLWWADELPRIKCPTLLVMPGAETVGSTRELRDHAREDSRLRADQPTKACRTTSATSCRIAARRTSWRSCAGGSHETRPTSPR